MKKTAIFTIVFLIFTVSVYAESYEIKGNRIFNDTTQSIIDGTFSPEPSNVINAFISSFFSEIKSTASELKTVLIICVISGLLKILTDSFMDSQAANSASLGCFLLAAFPILKLFSDIMGYASHAINNLCDFITKFEPVFMTMLISGGAVFQAAAFSPILAASVYISSVIINKCILPLCCFSAILGISDSLGELGTGALSKLVNSVSKWLLTGLLTLFTALLSIYGFASKAFNNVTVKGLKFTVGSLVPVVGGILSDTVDTVLSGANLIKNAVGTAGMVTVVSIVFIPVLKILAMLTLLRLCGALLEAFSEKRITAILGSVADAVKTAFSTVIATAVLFIISISVILLASGVSL